MDHKFSTCGLTVRDALGMHDLMATGRYDNHQFDLIQDRRPTDAAEIIENSTP